MPRFRVLTSGADLPPPNPQALATEFVGDHIPRQEQFRPHFGRALDLTTIDRAIQAANIGLMRQMTDLSRETISLDGHLSSLLMKRLNRIMALEWEVKPAEGAGVDQQKAEDYAQEVREELAMIPSLRQRFTQIAWGLFDGRSASEIAWARRDNRWTVKDLHWIHPRRLSFGPTRDLRIIDSTYETGNFMDVGFPIEEVPYKFITFKPQMFGDYQEREGLASRSVYWSFFKRFATREQLILMEIFGKPWRIMKPSMPATGSRGWNEKSLKAAFVALNALGYNNTVRLPPNVEIEVVQPQKGAGDVHKDVVQQSNDELSKLFVGQTLTTDAKAVGLGSNLGSIQKSEEDMLIEGDANRLAEALEDQLTDAIIIVNHGQAEVTHAPRFIFRTDPPKDRAAEAVIVKSALEIGLVLDEADVRERTGMIELQEGAPTLEGLPSAAPPGGAPGGFGFAPPPGGQPPLPPPPDDDADDDDIAAFVAQMNDLKAPACGHGSSNRCRKCGIERVREVSMGEDGKHAFGVKWRAIRRPKAAAVPELPEAPPPAVPALPGAQEPAAGEPTARPFAGFDSMDACVIAKLAEGLDQASAERECELLQAEADNNPDTGGPPEQGLSMRLAEGPPSEGGSHWHVYDAARKVTELDGMHTHLFTLPNGETIETEMGGAHQHRGDHGDWIHGGPHTHNVTLPDGIVRTEVDGIHEHELQVDTTTHDGMHRHLLVLANGATIESLLPSDIRAGESGVLGLVEQRQAMLLHTRRAHPLGDPKDTCCLAAQPSSTFGSPDDLVQRGIEGMATQTEALGKAIARAVRDLETVRDIRKAIKNAAVAFDNAKMAKAVDRELIQGLMLGALDAEFEVAAGERVKPEAFTDLHARALTNVRAGRTAVAKERVRLVEPGREPGFTKNPLSEALDSFRGKDVVTPDVFDNMTQAAQRRSFTVAGSANAEVVRAVQNELTSQIAAGANLREFASKVMPRLNAAGWTPVNPSQVETVFRTNVMNAYNSGRFRQMTQPAVLKVRPFLQVVTPNDGPPRQRPSHQNVHGVIVRADDPALATAYPPFGFNCRCRMRSVSAKAGEGQAVNGTVLQSAVDPGFSSGITLLV